jgi:hypothetical protein
MFFRRKRAEPVTFAQRLDVLRRGGFEVEPDSSGAGYLVSRQGSAAVVADSPSGPVVKVNSGVLMGGHIGVLVDGGFQKFFRTQGGARKPALAAELKALHAFDADLRAGLGLETLYNQSLGTVSSLYLYDRVKDRDRGAHS